MFVCLFVGWLVGWLVGLFIRLTDTYVYLLVTKSFGENERTNEQTDHRSVVFFCSSCPFLTCRSAGVEMYKQHVRVWFEVRGW